MSGIQKTKSKSLKGYIVNGEIFRTKDDVIKRVQGILYGCEPGQALNPDDFSFIFDLLKNHERVAEKIGCGVAAITVELNAKFPDNRNFWVIRYDGTKTDFSFLKCITPITPIKQFRLACRTAVVNQIQQFKIIHFNKYANEQGLVQCSITGEWVNKQLAHVDHIQPKTFEVLVDSFIQEQGIDINMVKYKGIEDGAIGREFADETLIETWAEYHRQNAKLRVISRLANLSVVKRNDSV